MFLFFYNFPNLILRLFPDLEAEEADCKEDSKEGRREKVVPPNVTHQSCTYIFHYRLSYVPAPSELSTMFRCILFYSIRIYFSINIKFFVLLYRMAGWVTV